MTLFHATYSLFSPGQEIIANTDCSYYPEVLAALEAKRPQNCLSRLRCVFAAESIINATTFLHSQNTDSLRPMHIFEVEMPLRHKAPFWLIGEIATRIKNERSIDSLVSEYWLPKHPWVFWEFFGPSFRVVREVPAATAMEMYVQHIKYAADRDLSISL